MSIIKYIYVDEFSIFKIDTDIFDDSLKGRVSVIAVEMVEMGGGGQNSFRCQK